MVPCIKGASSLDFKGFHSYYEELITKTRENKLTADDFQGTNITLTNPGGLGTIASVPRLMTGPGHDHRLRLARLPGRVGARPGGEDQGARRLQGDDDDLDLRPPGHPGSRVRARSCAGSKSCCRARTTSTSRSRPTSAWTPARSPRPTPPRPRPPPLGAGRRGSERAGEAGHRAAAGGAGRDLAAQGLPDARPPGRTARSARLRAQGRSGDPAGEPGPDSGADVADPRRDPPDRGRGRDPAGGAAANARGLLRDDGLPDRAPLLAPAADVAAGNDRDRRPSRAARRPRSGARCSTA